MFKIVKKLQIVSAVVLLTVAKSAVGQTIPDVAITGPALAAKVHGSYVSLSTPGAVASDIPLGGFHQAM